MTINSGTIFAVILLKLTWCQLKMFKKEIMKPRTVKSAYEQGFITENAYQGSTGKIVLRMKRRFFDRSKSCNQVTFFISKAYAKRLEIDYSLR